MDPKGSNLASTDLLEISQLVSGSYVTKSITGAEIIASVPPSVTAWGTITGTLSAQTDLNTALSGKVPTSRTLTINGTTQDLSADRTFTISTGITIGTTAITSGTVGRVLFEGTGNVVSESANLFWDNTNNRLAVGTSTQAYTLAVGGKLRVSAGAYWVDSGATALQVDGTASFSDNITLLGTKAIQFGTSATQIGGGASGPLTLRAGSGSTQVSLFSTGNFAINTTTDAGYKLDVNGTFRSINGSRYIQTGAGNEFFTVHDGTNALLRANSAIGTLILGRGENFKQSPTQTLMSYAYSGGGFSSVTKPFSFTADITAGNGGAGSRVMMGVDITGTSMSNYTSFFVHKITNALSSTYLNAVTYAYSNNDFHNAFNTNSGSTIIGGLSVNASAKLQVDSTTQGFLPPRLTTTEKNAIASPATGLMVYDTTLNLISVYNGTSWITL